MFRDKEIKIYRKTPGRYDENDIYIPGEPKFIKIIECDVQPYSDELLYKNYGYKEQVTKRVFCDNDEEIKKGDIVEYKDNEYIIKRIIGEWSNHMEMMIYDN